ncbi:MAG: hypothetical protein DSY92_01605 [Planctomycetota bacterium]|nr:MAG: hypothetical protein DSY92_01605 [Planctomycetota bacterium]
MAESLVGKVPPKLFKIGEVMSHTGISRQTIHDYTVGGFIEEDARTPAGHRLYGEWVFERLAKIRGLQAEGHSLKKIKQLIDEGKI